MWQFGETEGRREIRYQLGGHIRKVQGILRAAGFLSRVYKLSFQEKLGYVDSIVL